jgi:DMSO reductase anchor subunit
MSKTTIIMLILMAAIAVASMVMLSNPEHGQQLMQAQRDAALSAGARELVMGGLALAIGGYLVYFFMFRKE